MEVNLSASSGQLRELSSNLLRMSEAFMQRLASHYPSRRLKVTLHTYAVVGMSLLAPVHSRVAR